MPLICVSRNYSSFITKELVSCCKVSYLPRSLAFFTRVSFHMPMTKQDIRPRVVPNAVESVVPESDDGQDGKQTHLPLSKHANAFICFQ